MSFGQVKTANLGLKSTVTSPVSDQIYLCRWSPSRRQNSDDAFVVVIGPDDMGSEGVKKFFRGLKVSGTGHGHIIVFVDGVFVKEGDIDLGDAPTHPNLFWLPRGTNGFEAIGILSLAGTLENICFFSDGSDNLEAE